MVSNFMDNGVHMGLRRDAYGLGFRARHNFQNTQGKQVRGTARFEPIVNKFKADGGVFESAKESVKLIKTGDAVTCVLVKDGASGDYLRYEAMAVSWSTHTATPT